MSKSTKVVAKAWPRKNNTTKKQTSNVTVNTAVQEPYTCSFSLPKSDSELTYIFGDIEGYNNIFASTLNKIEDTISNDLINYVFLGDIYDYAKPHETISMVDKLLSTLNIERNNIFNNDTKEIDVIRAFRKLWKQKQLKCYSKFNIQYLHSKPKQSSIKNPKCLFIIGNKEVIFIQEIITSERITKKDDIFIVPADYKRKYKKPGQSTIKHTEYDFSINELNIMYSYLLHCHNYAIINKTLFIHCYINYKLFQDIGVNRIVAGHSKGYGRFIDDDFKGIDIYILDLTGIEDNVNNYMVLSQSKLKHSFNSNFKPVLEKLKYCVSEDPEVINLDQHPLAKSFEEEEHCVILYSETTHDYDNSSSDT